MHHRFYAPGLEPGAGVVSLPSDEADHLMRVLRLRAGAEVCVFNGRGYECYARIEQADRHGTLLRVVGMAASAPEAGVSLCLAQSVLKGDGMDEVVRDAVMVGVSEILPFVSAHAEVDSRHARAVSRVARWQRIGIASAKQCGRAVVPTVHQVATLEDCLGVRADTRFVLVEPGLAGVTTTSLRALWAEPVPASALLIVGPEGGWTDREAKAALDSGCIAITLGRRTLRANVAALVGITALQCVWATWTDETRRRETAAAAGGPS